MTVDCAAYNRHLTAKSPNVLTTEQRPGTFETLKDGSFPLRRKIVDLPSKIEEVPLPQSSHFQPNAFT